MATTAGIYHKTILEKDKEIKRLKKERDWWKEKVRKEIAGSYYSGDPVDRIMRQFDEVMKKIVKEGG